MNIFFIFSRLNSKDRNISIENENLACKKSPNGTKGTIGDSKIRKKLNNLFFFF